MNENRRRISRWFPWAGATLVVIPALWWLAARGSSTEQADWVEVRWGDLALGVEVTGTLRAVDTSLLGPPPVNNLWDYKISRLAPEGTEVKAGTPVLGFDTSELERRLEEKAAESASAQKEIEKQQIDLTLKRRDDELRLAEAHAKQRKAQLKVDRPPDLAAAADLERARLDLDLATREIAYLEEKMESERRAADAEMASLEDKRDRADQRVREIQDAIRRMTVTAPRDGTVIYVSNWRDEKKKVGDSCWREEKIVEVPDLDRMKAQGEVDEADAGKIAISQRATFRLDAHPGVEFLGKVKSIWGTVQRKSWNNPLKVVRLDIELDTTDRQRMRPGMRFSGTIETGKLSGVLVIPAEAVFPTPRGPVTWRETRFGPEEVSLTLGKRTAKEFEVLGGLEAGDRVSRRSLAPKDRSS